MEEWDTITMQGFFGVRRWDFEIKFGQSVHGGPAQEISDFIAKYLVSPLL